MSESAGRGDRDIWLGDVLEAWDALRSTTPEERAAVAETLGFDASALRRRAAAIATEPAPGISERAAVVAPPAAVSSTGRATAAAPRTIPSTIEIDDAGVDEAVPSWVAKASPLTGEQPSHATWKPPFVPLLRRQWARHIMSAIAAVPMAEGALDEPRLIAAVSALRPVLQVPRRLRPTLRRGVHVLLDRGAAMLPFARDVQDVVAQLRVTVGRDHVVAAAFEETPLAADVLWLRQRRRGAWVAPAAGTPILLVTDLGLSQRYGDTRGATVAEWVEFAERCRAAGCGMIALLPRRESSWPPALRKAFTIVPWDERTNVSTVLRHLSGSRPPR